MPKAIRFREISSGVDLNVPPPDGIYAVVTYDGSQQWTRYGFLVDRVFPWWAGIYKFKDGLCDMVAHGSDPGDMLSRYEVDEVCLVGLDADRRAELEKKIVEYGIKLAT